MTADFLEGLIGANLAASAAIVLVLIVRSPVRALAGARVAYGLWLIAPVAALASFLPPLTLRGPALIAPPIRPAAQAAVQAMDAAIGRAAPGGDASGLVLIVWAAGALAVMGLLLARQRQAMRRLGRLTRENGQSLRAANAAAGPAVIGFLYPRIVLPADFEGRFDARERDLILAHEEAHLKAGDVRMNGLVCAALCLNWFNPLVVFAAELVRADQELARDEAVVTKRPGARKAYATALLKAQTGAGALPFGCYWPARSPQVLKARIVMLSKAAPRAGGRASGAALVALLSLGAAWGAWAVNPKEAAPAVVRAIAPVVAAAPNVVLAQAPSPPADPRKDEATLRAEFLANLARLNAAQAAASAREREASANDAPLQQVAQFTNSINSAPAAAPPPPVETPAPPVARERSAPPLVIPTGPQRPSVITNPAWLSQPTPAEIANVFPERAMALGRDGRAVLQCVVQENGSLADCSVMSEAPAGYGFGAAAMKLYPRFMMTAQTRGGVSVAGAKVAAPVQFTLPGQP